MIDFSQISEYIAKCPHCDKQMPSDEPRPSCNECECCFCDIECREAFHSKEERHTHDYNKDLGYD
jgi:hypothetical protein